MRSYHDLYVWRRSHEFALQVHRYCEADWHPSRAVAFDQLRRASLSVPINVAEGHALGPGGRCRFHAKVAYGSAVETTALLEFLSDRGGEVGQMIDRSKEIQALLVRFLLSLK
jgi:four helix bundle protein